MHQAIGIPINTGEYFDSSHISAMSVNILPFRTEHEKTEDILANWREIFRKRHTPFSKIAQLDKTQPFRLVLLLSFHKVMEARNYRKIFQMLFNKK